MIVKKIVPYGHYSFLPPGLAAGTTTDIDVTMTPKMAETLSVIDAFIRRRGYSPSYDEIRAATGMVSKSSVHRVVGRLIADGRLRRATTCHRNLEPVWPAQALADRIVREAQRAGAVLDAAALRRIIVGVLGRSEAGDGRLGAAEAGEVGRAAWGEAMR